MSDESLADTMKSTLQTIAKTLNLTRDEYGNKRKASCHEITQAIVSMKRKLDAFEESTKQSVKKAKHKNEGLSICIPDIPIENKKFIDELPDIPMHFGIKKYDCFQGDNGVNLLVAGYNKSKPTFNIMCFLIADVMQNKISKKEIKRYRTSFVSNKMGTLDQLKSTRVQTFWEKFGGTSRILYLKFSDEEDIEPVKVIDLKPGGYKQPVSVLRISNQRCYNVNMHMLQDLDNKF